MVPNKAGRLLLSGHNIKIQLTLRNLKDLFSEPSADPFDPDSRFLSGIDEIVGKMRLRQRALDKKSRLLILLPQKALSPESKSNLRDALNRYCAAKIAENQQAINELRISNRQQAISALVIVAVIFVLTVFLVNILPDFRVASGVIASFVGIAVWLFFGNLYSITFTPGDQTNWIYACTKISVLQT